MGAACVALVGPASAFGFDGLTFVASAFCLFAMRLPAPSTSVVALAPVELAPTVATPIPSEIASSELVVLDESNAPTTLRKGIQGIMEDIREGLGYVMSSTWIWVTIVIASAGNIFMVAPLVVAMPKLVHDVYGYGVWLLGALATASAVGSILAVLIVGQTKQMHRRGIKAYLALIGSGLALIGMGLPLPHISQALVAIAASIVIGFGTGFFNVIWFTVLQQLIPADKLGRVSSIDMMGSLCLTPIGFALGGIVTDAIGPRLVFISSGIISALLPMIALTIRGIRALD